jgi:hypothetical protein
MSFVPDISKQNSPAMRRAVEKKGSGGIYS